MRQKERLGLRQERGGSGVPLGKWLPRLCHKSCRCCQGGSPSRRLEGFPTQKRQDLRQNGACCHQETMRHVPRSRHDTLCVTGAVPLFLREEEVVAFVDVDYVGTKK